MSRFADVDVILDTVFEVHCKECERRKGIKNGKLKVIYEVGEAPCKSCGVNDMREYLEDAPTTNVKEVTPCEECIHAKQHSYAPAECQYYCTISLQYHGGRFFCACGERGTDLLEWIHRGDDDEQGV